MFLQWSWWSRINIDRGIRTCQESQEAQYDLILIVINQNSGIILQWAEFQLSTPNIADSGDRQPGARGIFGGGEQPTVVSTIDYVNISSTGNAKDFGDLSGVRRNQHSTSDRSRLIFTGGYTPSSPSYYNEAQFVTVASTGNTSDFGDLTVARSRHTGFGSQTRGFAAGGLVPSPTTRVDTIDYCTIQSAGNFVDFGNLSTAAYGVTGSQSPTRGLILVECHTGLCQLE